MAALFCMSADASLYGLGAVLLQENLMKASECHWLSLACRAMTLTEQKYAQVEKKSLATWAFQCFRMYMFSLQFSIEADHKLLTPLLSKKKKPTWIDEMTPRLQCFRKRAHKYGFRIHIPEKDMRTDGAVTQTTAALRQTPHISHKKSTNF